MEQKKYFLKIKSKKAHDQVRDSEIGHSRAELVNALEEGEAKEMLQEELLQEDLALLRHQELIEETIEKQKKLQHGNLHR